MKNGLTALALGTVLLMSGCDDDNCPPYGSPYVNVHNHGGNGEGGLSWEKPTDEMYPPYLYQPDVGTESDNDDTSGAAPTPEPLTGVLILMGISSLVFIIRRA